LQQLRITHAVVNTEVVSNSIELNGAALVDWRAMENSQAGGDRNKFGAEINEQKPKPLRSNLSWAPMKTEGENITRQEILEHLLKPGLINSAHFAEIHQNSTDLVRAEFKNR
jgi:hypothetical protein